ncbi:MAG: CoA transferase [Vicinamibacterales bacterium]
MPAPPPLARTRIVSLALNVPGPVALARLVAAGASATKIEPPAGDPLSTMCPAWYDAVCRGVEVVEVDLKTPEGQSRLAALLADADLLLTSQRPGALARLGLSSERLATVFPGLRHLNIVGQVGNPERAGHDLTYQATHGLIDERLPSTLLADLVGAERVVSEALLLLAGPPGGHATVGLEDSLALLDLPGRYGLTVPGGLLGGGLPEYGVYPSADGHVAVAALEPRFRSRLYAELGRAPGTSLGDAFVGRTAAAWAEWAEERDLPIVAVRSIREQRR